MAHNLSQTGKRLDDIYMREHIMEETEKQESLA